MSTKENQSPEKASSLDGLFVSLGLAEIYGYQVAISSLVEETLRALQESALGEGQVEGIFSRASVRVAARCRTMRSITQLDTEAADQAFSGMEAASSIAISDMRERLAPPKGVKPRKSSGTPKRAAAKASADGGASRGGKKGGKK